MLENSGLMKAGPGQKEWEPATGKTVKFSDVHGIDEAKEVRVGYGQFSVKIFTNVLSDNIRISRKSLNS